MSIAEKRIPQDGRIQSQVGAKTIDLRVSCLPTNHGESIVMRILDKEGLKLGLPELGFFTDDQQTFERLIGLPDGILLVTGPTGSGKTTTLYSCLNFINRPDRKIITVEDPVEYVLAGINQVQVSEIVGLTFAAALRSMLRQAPNVIMLGEIRDLETATIAINASLTGHLVFSTLHTNDAPAAITRLVDMGVEPYLVASSLVAVLAQRLVRVLCPDCREAYTPSAAELTELGVRNPGPAKAFHPKGCHRCHHTGYFGRVGIFELMVPDDELRAMIVQNTNPASVAPDQTKVKQGLLQSLIQQLLRVTLFEFGGCDVVVNEFAEDLNAREELHLLHDLQLVEAHLFVAGKRVGPFDAAVVGHRFPVCLVRAENFLDAQDQVVRLLDALAVRDPALFHVLEDGCKL
jgi:general secretion pathway protein E/type IV pilus assembly protein PilB